MKQIIKYPNGDTYDGEIVSNKRHGSGTYICANGDKYVGEFTNGMCHGQGTMSYNDGTIQSGTWKYGKYVETTTDIDININPFTKEAILKIDEIQFNCPTCQNTVSVKLQEVDPIIGVHVLCSQCKNISHVPGKYRIESTPKDLKITGGIVVPIKDFSDWYYNHTYISSLILEGKSDLLNEYGLWAFCSGCFYQFPKTIINRLAMLDPLNQHVTFFANTPDSAKDWGALSSGHCSHCSSRDLLVIATEIPEYVSNEIRRNSKTF